MNYWCWVKYAERKERDEITSLRKLHSIPGLNKVHMKRKSIEQNRKDDFRGEHKGHFIIFLLKQSWNWCSWDSRVDFSNVSFQAYSVGCWKEEHDAQICKFRPCYMCVCLINDIFESLEFFHAARKCLFIDTFLRKKEPGCVFFWKCVCSQRGCQQM